MAEKKYIQSIQRALKILEYVREHRSAKLIDIYQDLTMNKSTVFGILQTLEFEGYLIKEEDGSSYKLGLESLSLGLAYLNSTDFNTKIHKLLNNIVSIVDETAYFVIKTGDKYYYLDHVLSSQPLKVVPEGKKFLDLTDASAAGQVYLNYKNDDFKYAKDLENILVGINCFAVPYMIGEKIAGCLSITGPSNRYTETKIDETYKIYEEVLKKL